MSRSSDRINRMREHGGLGGFPSSLGGMPGFGELGELMPKRRSLIRMVIAFAAAHALLCLCILAVSAVVGAFAWPYAINEWLVFAGKPAAVGPLHGALIGLVPGFGQAALPVAVVTWIAMLFLGA